MGVLDMRPTSRRIVQRSTPNLQLPTPKLPERFLGVGEGYGLKRIAKQRTAEGAASPKPFVRKDAYGLPPVGAWVPSTVRGVLRREDYVGRYVWNKTRKRNEWGEVEQRRRPESEWQRTAIPEWRIVSDDLWQRVQERLIDAADMACRCTNGKLVGRPRKRMVTNLLANLLIARNSINQNQV